MVGDLEWRIFLPTSYVLLGNLGFLIICDWNGVRRPHRSNLAELSIASGVLAGDKRNCPIGVVVKGAKLE